MITIFIDFHTLCCHLDHMHNISFLWIIYAYFCHFLFGSYLCIIFAEFIDLDHICIIFFICIAFAPFLIWMIRYLDHVSIIFAELVDEIEREKKEEEKA